MQGTKALFLLWALIALILSGCATPAPLSETIIFPPQHVKADTVGSYKGSLTLMPAYNFYKKRILKYGNQLYKTVYQKENDERPEYYNYQKFGLGLSDTFTDSVNWAIGFSIGYALLGLNFTTRIKGPYFLTAQISALGGGQVILQRPVFKLWDGGVTLGPYYRYDNYYIDIDTGGFAINLKRFVITSVGLRTFFQFQSSFTPFYGYIESGYSPELKRVLFYVDFTTPILKFRKRH